MDNLLGQFETLNLRLAPEVYFELIIRSFHLKGAKVI